MSVMKESEANKSDIIRWSELDERERILIERFRLLDEVCRQDILRFISVLLSL